MGYTKDAVRGVSWIMLLRVVTRIITFIRLGILGRLLSPTQFGYFGIATLVLSLLEILTETGINIFLVQEKGHIKEYINSAWIVSILRGFILALVILVLSPLITVFFNAPEAFSVIALMAVVPFLRGFINPAIILYQKELFFRQEFQLRTSLFVIDVIISVVVGFLLQSAIAFVLGLIASALIEVILSYLLFPLRPKLIFEYEKIKYIIRRGGWVTAMGIFSYFADNGDNIVVGRFLGPGALGIYQVAYKFSTLPVTEITNVVGQVIFPVFAKFSEEKERLWNAFLKVTILSTLGALVLGGGIFLFAEPIIFLFMGQQWIAAVPVIKLLAIYGVLRTIFGNFGPLFLALGKQNYVAQMNLVRVCALFISVVPLVMQFGMIGAGYAMLFSILIEIPIIIYLTQKEFRTV